MISSFDTYWWLAMVPVGLKENRAYDDEWKKIQKYNRSRNMQFGDSEMGLSSLTANQSTTGTLRKEAAWIRCLDTVEVLQENKTMVFLISSPHSASIFLHLRKQEIEWTEKVTLSSTAQSDSFRQSETLDLARAHIRLAGTNTKDTTECTDQIAIIRIICCILQK